MYIQMYADGRLFSWDERKSAANLAERGFDFDFASLVFAGPTLEREDTRRDYGERRVIALGLRMAFHRRRVHGPGDGRRNDRASCDIGQAGQQEGVHCL